MGKSGNQMSHLRVVAGFGQRKSWLSLSDHVLFLSQQCGKFSLNLRLKKLPNQGVGIDCR